MAPRDDLEGAEVGIGRGELNGEVEPRTSQGVPTQAAVDVPRQVGQPLVGGRALEHGERAECPVRMADQVGAAEPDEALDAGIVVECADHP